MLKNEPNIFSTNSVPLKSASYRNRKRLDFFTKYRTRFFKKIKSNIPSLKFLKKCFYIKTLILWFFQKTTLPAIFIFYGSIYCFLHIAVLFCDNTFRTLRFIPLLIFKIGRCGKRLLLGGGRLEFFSKAFKEIQIIKKTAFLFVCLILVVFIHSLFFFFVVLPYVVKLNGWVSQKIKIIFLRTDLFFCKKNKLIWEKKKYVYNTKFRKT